MNKNWILRVVAFFLGWLIFINPASASDHQDAPKIFGTPVLDISDLFAFTMPEQPNHLVLIMNALPLASESAWFSDTFDYSIVVRPASISGTGSEAGFTTGDQEFRFTCNFKAPSPRRWSRSNDSKDLVQRGTCRGPAGISAPVVVNDEDGTQVPGMRVFAGRRLDSFFLDFQRIAKGQLGPDVEGKNSLQNKNVLSIVIDADMDKVFGSQEGSMFAVVGEVNTVGKPAIRVDRQGRSEMTNITLSLKQFDQVNKDLDVRDLYNQEDTFKLLKDYIGAYRARFNANLGFWDNVDGKVDWQLKDNNQHPLTDLLLNDILVIDTAKPCTEQSYFEIEKAILADRPYATCGGRKPNEDTVDTALTLYVNGGNGPHVGDGVNQPTQLASNTFPYLAPPYTAK
ncbi:DUF4331 family protein [Chroococcidiopsis sp. CCMEE 29]|uniref:DUF4331 family protein n=1 Tax=Chroococcidiopsis sp. CCMEE 29 TaxID=155894 RepID=UPI0020213D27|nr:DUF4331 family protein [Chroococcidiopsis sp. CCMEE 29]